MLCDTNGGTMTAQLAEICADVRKKFEGVLGIHTHNDCELGRRQLAGRDGTGFRPRAGMH